MKDTLSGVIPSPFAVILSAAKDLRSSLRVNSARNLALRLRAAPTSLFMSATR
jgi:hypothetical protein